VKDGEKCLVAGRRSVCVGNTEPSIPEKESIAGVGKTRKHGTGIKGEKGSRSSDIASANPQRGKWSGVQN
jgi:hypothetical protein